MACESKIIVGAEIDHLIAPGHVHMSVLLARDETFAFVEPSCLNAVDFALEMGNEVFAGIHAFFQSRITFAASPEYMASNPDSKSS